MSEFDAELDATNMACPLPIIKARKAVSALTAGQILKITATDPGSVKDFAAFCSQTGNELVSSTEDSGSGTYTFMIKITG
jgi:tRNA 2-thiouridine synthesizing protein A